MPTEKRKRRTCSKLSQDVARPVTPGTGEKSTLRGWREEPERATLRAVPSFFGIPASTFAIGLGVNESVILRTLVVARRLVSRGWCQQVAWCDEEGRTNPADIGPATHFSLVGAIKSALGGGYGEALAAHYALQHVRKVLGEYDLSNWNDNPIRTKRQVLDLLDRCALAAGGKPARRGGWAISGRAA